MCSVSQSTHVHALLFRAATSQRLAPFSFVYSAHVCLSSDVSNVSESVTAVKDKDNTQFIQRYTYVFVRTYGLIHELNY
jgi:hypothetical protein